MDPSAFIPGAGKDSSKGAKSSDTNPLIPPQLRSIFKKKKVVEVTSRLHVAPSLGKWIFSFKIFSSFLIMNSLIMVLPFLFRCGSHEGWDPIPECFLLSGFSGGEGRGSFRCLHFWY